MRRCKVDSNQKEIVKALRAMGATVGHTHTVGDGFPDIVAGIGGVNLLLEIKDGKKPPSQRKLTADEDKWHQEWRGQVAIVESIDDAIKLIKEIQK